MLCDDVVTPGNGLEIFKRVFSRLQAEVAVAEKFSLDADITAAADQLSNWNPEIDKAIPFCRLPYASCWFEFRDIDRHSTDGLGLAPGEIRPHRVGFLVKAEGTDMGVWRAHLFWSHEHRCVMSSLAPVFSIYQPHGLFEDKPQASPFFAHHGHIPAYLRRVMLNDSNWQGEIGFLMAVLSLLNSKNVSETEYIDRAKMNAKRHLSGKLPKYSHHLLKLRLSLKSRLEREGGGVAGSSKVRHHFVRGHFKIRKSGLFWWSPHARGGLRHGFASKDYRVTT